MRKLKVFNNVTLDGYFTDSNGDMSWAHEGNDEEFNSFVRDNAQGESEFLFGRVTYELMASYWPTPHALENMPIVAKKMNETPKTVFSKTLSKTSWNNTKLLKGDLVTEVQKLKKLPGNDLLIFGSGSLVSQLATAGLIDQYQFVLTPIALGEGRSSFDKIGKRQNFKLVSSRVFPHGKIFLCYE
jgi:dihydrofolate reductase